MVNHSTHKESLNGEPFRLSLWVEWLTITVWAFFMGGMVDHHRLGFLYGWNG
jgi:hypothetical protein